MATGIDTCCRGKSQIPKSKNPKIPQIQSGSMETACVNDTDLPTRLCPGSQDSEETHFSAGLMAVNPVIQGPGSSQQELLGRKPLPKLWNQCKVVCGILLLDYHWQPPKIGLQTELTLKPNRTKRRAWKNHQLLSAPISFLLCPTSCLELHLHLFTFMKHFNENRSMKDRTTQLW